MSNDHNAAQVHPQPPPIDGGHSQHTSGRIPATVPEHLFPELKARAQRESGTDEVRVVTVAGIPHEYVIRAATKAEFDAYSNGASDVKKALGANRALMMQCTIWPERHHIPAEERGLPNLPNRICDHLETWAGLDTPESEVIVKAGDSLDPDGCDTEKELLLVSQYPEKGQLMRVKFVTTPRDWPDDEQNVIRLIVKMPSKGVYEQLLSTFNDDRAAALYDLALSCVVVPSEIHTLRAILAKYPGIAIKLGDVLVHMAGAGAKTSAKKR